MTQVPVLQAGQLHYMLVGGQGQLIDPVNQPHMTYMNPACTVRVCCSATGGTYTAGRKERSNSSLCSAKCYTCGARCYQQHGCNTCWSESYAFRSTEIQNPVLP
ncbi:hypothetical protein DPMN_069772 [Dreissena polymorpha]|uniref:Uncharacterized protein n=1 Tax=Dreissena polymorpha TaxID=45954 RepID=A0A9D4BV73_DREPO|nr:hypothetical protein DPMN_069772 [Dreissena polymorpha]